MSKQARSRRRPPSSNEPAVGADSPALPRVVWLLVLLLCLTALTIPVYRWYGGLIEQAVTQIADEPAAVSQNRLQSLPSEAVYPEVEALRAEADQLTAKLLELYPESASALHLAANQAAQLRQYEQAGEYWRRAIALAPDYAGPQAGLALTQMEQGQDQQAVETLEAAIEAGCETAEIYQLLCRATQKIGEVQRAEVACREGLRRFPEDPVLWLELGQLQLQLQQLTEAKASLERALQLEPESIPTYFSLATVWARLGDEAKANEYKARYTELKEQHPLASVRFQVIYRAALQRIVVHSLLGAGNEHRMHGNLDLAEQAFLRALTLQPRHVDACRSLVQLYRQQERIADAHLVQQRLVDTEPSVENLVNLASLALPLDRHGEAEAALLAALQLDPQSLVVHRSLVLFYLHIAQLPQARAHAEQLAALQPTAENLELLRQIRSEMGNQPGFQAATERVRRNGPP